MALEVIDFHSHHIGRHWALTTASTGTAENRRRWEEINRLLTDRAALLADIDHGDLAARVVNSPTAFVEGPGGALPPGAHARLNDELAELVVRLPGHLFGLASVDVFGGEAGAREVERAARDLGLSGVFVPSAQGDLLLDAPQARPTLEAAAAAGLPVFVHPVNPEPLSAQLEPYGRLGTLLARGTVNSATLVALLAGGVLEDLPRLKVVVTTLAVGGVLLAGTFGKAPELPLGAAALLRRQVHVDTMGFNPVVIRALVDTLGVDNVLAGSDWPIVSTGPIGPRLEQALTAAGLDPAAQAKIASDNARRLLRVERTLTSH